MSPPPRIDTLAVRLCHAVRVARGEDKTWIGIDCLGEFLAGNDAARIDAALAFAGAKGWVSISDGPAGQVLLTPRGIAASKVTSGASGINVELSRPRTAAHRR